MWGSGPDQRLFVCPPFRVKLRCRAAAAKACRRLRARLCRRDDRDRPRREAGLRLSRSRAACGARDDGRDHRLRGGVLDPRPLLAHGFSRRADPRRRALVTRRLEPRLRRAAVGLRPEFGSRLRLGKLFTGALAALLICVASLLPRRRLGTGRRWPLVVFGSIVVLAVAATVPMAINPEPAAARRHSLASRRRGAPDRRRIPAHARAAVHPGGVRLCAAKPPHGRRAQRMARDRVHPRRGEQRQLLLPSLDPLGLGLYRRRLPSRLLPRPPDRRRARDRFLLDERRRGRLARGTASSRARRARRACPGDRVHRAERPAPARPGSRPELVERILRGVARAQEESRRVVGALGRRSQTSRSNRRSPRQRCDAARRHGAALDMELASGISLSPRQREAVVRIASEAVANAAQHSGAETLRLYLERLDAGIRLGVIGRRPGVRRRRAEARLRAGHHEGPCRSSGRQAEGRLPPRSRHEGGARAVSAAEETRAAPSAAGGRPRADTRGPALGSDARRPVGRVPRRPTPPMRCSSARDEPRHLPARRPDARRRDRGSLGDLRPPADDEGRHALGLRRGHGPFQRPACGRSRLPRQRPRPASPAARPPRRRRR